MRCMKGSDGSGDKEGVDGLGGDEVLESVVRLVDDEGPVVDSMGESETMSSIDKGLMRGEDRAVDEGEDCERRDLSEGSTKGR